MSEKESAFAKKFLSLLAEKDTILCVGLDPALPRQRKKNVIPLDYLKNSDENEARLNFCLNIIERTADYCIAAKPNQKYILGFTKKEHQKLTDSIRTHQMISILDCKLNDVKEALESAIYHLSECGYDAITFDPFPGNLEEAVNFAHKSIKLSIGRELGIIVLTLMSNPEAIKYMKKARIKNLSVYLVVAKDVRKYEADGCVIGATNHVTEEDIRAIRAMAGEDKIFLIPGVGSQKGDHKKAIKAGGKNILINVGRDIIYSINPKEKAREYCQMFNMVRKSIDY